MEILFENPIILIALLGIISSLFKRIKGNNQQGPKIPPQHQRAPLSPGTVKEETLNSTIDVRNAMEAESFEREFITTKKQAEGSRRGLQEERRTTELKVQPIQKAAGSYRSRTSDETDKVKESLSVTEKQTLINGIIWSEILGPPRAKKPHSSIKER